MKPAFSETYKVTKTFDAPMDFVYAWCTDFQEDDLTIIGSRNTRMLHEKSKKRIIWTVEKPGAREETDPVRVVWLRPPNAWHLESSGDGYEVGDYRLVPLGKNRTRLDMTFTVLSATKADLQSQKEYIAEADEHWLAYGAELEQDYRRSLRK